MVILPFLTPLLLKIVGFLLSGILMFSAAAPATTIEAKEPENVKLQFSVVADVHMETYTLFRFRDFTRALRDMGAAKQRQDALVLVGDNTMNGQPTEYIMLYGLLSRYNKAENFLAAMGNHDLNRGSYATPDAIARHNLFLQSYTGMVSDKPYYSQAIDDYFFFILGDENPYEDTTATISQAQLDFLSAFLSVAPKDKPVFIFLHQSLNHAFANYGWGGVGEQSEALREILESRPNVFVFNGHLHRPYEVKQIDGVTYVNLPTLLSGGENGIGCQVEAYEDGVVLRARNYVKGEWLGETEISLNPAL